VARRNERHGQAGVLLCVRVSSGCGVALYCIVLCCIVALCCTSVLQLERVVCAARREH
jgi:hypothetical protein